MKNTTVLYVISSLVEGEEGILRKIRNKDRRPARRALTVAAAAPTVGTGASVAAVPAGLQGAVPTPVGAAAAPVSSAPVILSVTGVFALACLCD